MPAVAKQTKRQASAREVAVWDPLVRLIHWSLALTILLNGAFIEEESKAHEWIGYIALGLVGLRLVWGLTGPKHTRFSVFPPHSARAIRHQRAMFGGDRSKRLSRNPLGALMVYNIWASIIAMGITGYMMTTVTFFGVDWVEQAHKAIFSWLILSVALHVAAVAFDNWRSRINLIRAKMDDRRTIPSG